MSDSRERNNLDVNDTYAHQDSDVSSQHFAERKAEIQAAFLLPHLRPGMSLLDCGCGPGTITLGSAELVAPGQVIGFDIGDKQIELAQAQAVSRGISNVHFETGNIYDQRFADSSFDAVFSNGVLSHLSDPLAVLAEISRVLKSGGVVGIRNPDFSGHLIAPDDPMLLRFWDTVVKLVEVNGGNPFIGRHQRAFLRQAGFINVEASATYESYGSLESIQYWGKALSNALHEESHVKQITELGLADADELTKMGMALEEWTTNPDAFFADAWCEAVGWKA